MSAIVERAVVLAAGLGTRLTWLTRSRPKAMMRVAGATAIERVIRRLVGFGIRDIAINVHHHAAQLEGYLGDGGWLGARLYYSRERHLLDSGGGARQALQLLPGKGPVLVHNADIQSDIDVLQLARCLPGQGCALALVPNPAHHPGGDFALLGDGRVAFKGTRRLTFAGVSLWWPAWLEQWPSGQGFPLTACIRACIQQDCCRGMRHSGYWFDIGRPADLMAAYRHFSLPR